MTSDADKRAWETLDKVVQSATDEQRRARRWGVFFKLLTFAYIFVALWLFYPRDMVPAGLGAGPHTAVVKIHGPIAENEPASANRIAQGLRAAFEHENTAAVLLAINSPGGSPVQAGYVYDEIARLRGEHPDKKVYAVISDLGASGAYYIAAAADEIYADEASLVGSIGVISASFGFVEAMDKIGVERRLFTAGEHKGFLDPFSPLQEEQEAFWEEVLETTHRQFINRVRAGRGERLADDPSLYSGRVWSGEQALQLGLVDGLGSAGYVAREVVGAENTVDFTPRRDPFRDLLGDFGAAVGRGLAVALEERALQLR